MRVSAKSAILINSKTGQVLFEKNKDVKRPCASLTKIASALVILDKVQSLEGEVVCNPVCLKKMPKKQKMEKKYDVDPYLLEPDGMSYGIYNGEILSVKDLFYGMFLRSANDAANVLAYHFSNGHIDKFVFEMNKFVSNLGCQNTTFYNPHGLHFPGHGTTASDLALMAREAVKDPRLMEVASAEFYHRPKTNKQPAMTLWATNKLLRRGELHYHKAKGLKTGYVENAGFCFVGFAEDDSRSLISVLLGCKNSATAFKETKRLFEAAFNESKTAQKLYNAQESVFSKHIKGAKSELKACLKKDVFISFYPSEKDSIKPEIVWYEKSLPINKGDKVGHILILSEDEKHYYLAAPLYSVTAVEMKKPVYLKLLTFLAIVLVILAGLRYGAKILKKMLQLKFS